MPLSEKMGEKLNKLFRPLLVQEKVSVKSEVDERIDHYNDAMSLSEKLGEKLNRFLRS